MSRKHIGKTLQTLKKKNNLSQKQMAKIVDISVSHYAFIEKGEIYPSIFEVLMKVRDKFNLKKQVLILIQHLFFMKYDLVLF